MHRSDYRRQPSYPSARSSMSSTLSHSNAPRTVHHPTLNIPPASLFRPFYTTITLPSFFFLLSSFLSLPLPPTYLLFSFLSSYDNHNYPPYRQNGRDLRFAMLLTRACVSYRVRPIFRRKLNELGPLDALCFG